MKVSGRNYFSGKVVEVKKGSTTAHVAIEIAGGTVVIASITNEAVDELELTVGKQAHALIKSSDVMVVVD